MAVKRIPEAEIGEPTSPVLGRRDSLYSRRIRGKNLRLKLVSNNHLNPSYDWDIKDNAGNQRNKRNNYVLHGDSVNTPRNVTPSDDRQALSCDLHEIGAQLRVCGDTFNDTYSTRARKQDIGTTARLLKLPQWVRVSALAGCVWLVWNAVTK